MQPSTTPHRPHPAPRRLTLAKETLRRLTPADLRLAAGGAGGVTRPSNNPVACRGGWSTDDPNACRGGAPK